MTAPPVNASRRGCVDSREHPTTNETSLLLFPVVYALLAWVLFADLNLFDGGRLPGCACEDPVNQVWFLAFARESITTGHLPFWTDLMGYPAGFNAASSASFPLLGAVAAPLTAAIGPVATYNLLARLGLLVSALSGWLVLRRLVASPFAAGVGGLLYGFSPYTVHIVQLHMFLAWVPLPPVVLYLLYRQLAEGAGSPWKTGVAVGALVAAQYLIDAEIAASLVLVAVAVIVVVLVGRVLRRSPVLGGIRSGAIITVAAGALALVLLAYPVWQFLYGPQHVSLTQPSKASGFPAITTLLAPTAPNIAGNLAGNVDNLAGRIGLLSTPYSGLFGGIGYLGPVLITALGWIVVRNRRSLLVRVSAVLLVVAWVLALGPHLAATDHVTHISLPMRWIMHLPALHDLVAGRITLYMWLAVAVLVAAATDRFIARLRAGSPRPATWFSGTAASLAVFGCLIAAPDGRIDSYPTGPTRRFLSPRIQARIPTGGLVLTYPYASFPQDQPMLWQAADDLRFKLVGGYAKFPGPTVAYLEPPLLKPTTVECFFGQAQFPKADWNSEIPGGCPLAPINLNTTTLRSFVHRNHISTVVVDREGAHPHEVIQAITAAFGQPAGDPPFFAWRT